MASVSKVDIEIDLQGKGTARGGLFRHLSPLTLGALMKRMPIQGRVARFSDQFIYILSGVVAGVEKARRNFSAGDITFLASNGAVCIFLKDVGVATPMNPLGRVVEGLDLLRSASAGDVIVIRSTQ